MHHVANEREAARHAHVRPVDDLEVDELGLGFAPHRHLHFHRHADNGNGGDVRVDHLTAEAQLPLDVCRHELEKLQQLRHEHLPHLPSLSAGAAQLVPHAVHKVVRQVYLLSLLARDRLEARAVSDSCSGAGISM